MTADRGTMCHILAMLWVYLWIIEIVIKLRFNDMSVVDKSQQVHTKADKTSGFLCLNRTQQLTLLAIYAGNPWK